MAVGIFQGARGLYDYLQGIQAYPAPPIVTVFFFGVSRRTADGLWNGRASAFGRYTGDAGDAGISQ
jgi:hypothetical protein